MADKVLGMLPDPFIMNNGTRITSAAQWKERRAEILKTVIDLEYGGMPPKPARTWAEPLMVQSMKRISGYRVHADKFTFYLQLFTPEKMEGRLPVIIDGDGCFNTMNDEVVAELNRRGFIAARFDRTELAPDLYNAERNSGIYPLYPEYGFGALAAWAWGYHRVVDVLREMRFVDPDRIGITGHSRGGKTVLLAGATDERIAFTCPNNSGGGGAACYRYRMQLDEAPAGADMRSETLKDLMDVVHYWFGQGMRDYIDCEEKLPFDQHMLKALVAPRGLLQTEALGDAWANPKGTWQTHLAAKEVYKLLGVPEKIGFRVREGGHGHDMGAFAALMDMMEQGSAPEINPFPDMEKIFDWKAPV